MEDNKLNKNSDINYRKSISLKKKNFLMNKKEERKNIHFKELHFNPSSYFREKYSNAIPKIINKKKTSDDIVKSSNKVNNDYHLTRKKLKLKPLNMNRSNMGNHFHPKIDDIIIPSNKTSQELIDYNKMNSHNTNSFEQNNDLNFTNKILSSSESFNNINTNSFNNQNNNNQENQEKVLKRSIQVQKSFLDTEQIIKHKKKFRKSKIDIYESEIFAKGQVLKNLNHFHKNFFNKEDRKIHYKLNPIFKEDNPINSDKIISPNYLKEMIEMENLNKNPFFDSNYKTIDRTKKNLNRGRYNLSYKEMKSLSLEGYRRMQADKRKKFNIRLNNTNKAVLHLEQKLDELFQINKRIFLDEKEV